MVIRKNSIVYNHNLKRIPLYYGKNRIKDLPLYLRELSFDRIAIITDFNVKKYWGGILKQVLSSYNHKFFTFPAGEKSKNFENYQHVVNLLFDWKINRNSLIIAFGGGVVGNLAGFVSSTIYRGIKFVHIPTTIISQADSTIGGRQSINTSYGKNTIGSIYEPEIILTDFNFLKTLSEKEIKSGIAELIKHALCQDKTFLKKLSKKESGKKYINKLVENTIKLKVNLFESDKEGANESKVFVYGHEIGHVIESLSKGKLTHGESISIGMCLSAKLSNKLGYLSDKDLKEHFTILEKWDLPTKIPKNLLAKNIVNELELMGKLVDNQIEIILLRNIGLPVKTKGLLGNIIKKENLLKIIEGCY